MGLDGVRSYIGGGSGSNNLGPGTPVGAQSTTSISMTVANPGISNILSATLLISPIGATTNFLKVDSSINAGSSPGLISEFAAYPIYEKTSSVLQLGGITTQVPGGTFSIQVNQASGSTAGYLSAADWTTFNGKQSALQIGAFSATSFAQGATLFGPTFQLGVGDGTNPGLISTVAQTIAGIKTFTGTLLGPLGTTLLPAFSFSADPDTGIYNESANVMAITAGGVQRMTVGGAIGMRVAAYITAGQGSTPSYSFSADASSGVYLKATGQVGIGASAASVAYFDMNSLNLQTQKELRFQDFSGGEYVGMKAGATVTTYTMTWPSAQGATYSGLRNDGQGNLSFVPFNSQISSAVSSQTITSGSAADVTNLTVTITTTGRPVQLMLVSSGSGTSVIQLSQNTTNVTGKIYFVRDVTTISTQEVQAALAPTATLVQLEPPASGFNHFDGPVLAPGTYVYKVQASIGGSSSQTIFFDAIKLVAFEY